MHNNTSNTWIHWAYSIESGEWDLNHSNVFLTRPENPELHFRNFYGHLGALFWSKASSRALKIFQTKWIHIIFIENHLSFQKLFDFFYFDGWMETLSTIYTYRYFSWMQKIIGKQKLYVYIVVQLWLEWSEWKKSKSIWKLR